MRYELLVVVFGVVEAVASHSRAAICIIFIFCSLDNVFHVTSMVFTLLSRNWNRVSKTGLRSDVSLRVGETKNIFPSN